MVLIVTQGGATDGEAPNGAGDPGAATTAPDDGPATTNGAQPGDTADSEDFPDSRDELDGRDLVDEIDAAVSQIDNVDRYPIPLSGGEACPREIMVALTAPAGLTMQLQIYQGEVPLDAVDAAGGVPAQIVVRPLCNGADQLSAVVAPTGPPIDTTPYILERIDG
jgi:hypothetical protein